MENTVPRRIDWPRHSVWISALLLYGVSLCLPALVFDRTGSTEHDTMFGFEIALIGWLGILVGQFAWLANFTWFISLFGIAFRIPLLALIPSVIALLISLNTFLLFAVDIPADEGGVNHMRLIFIGPGAWIWWLALLVPFAWGTFAFARQIIRAPGKL